MKKLMITVNGKRYEVDVEVVQDDEAVDVQPPFRPPARTMDSYVTPVTAPAADLSPKGNRRSDKKTLTSPINGVILEIPVKEGQAGQGERRPLRARGHEDEDEYLVPPDRKDQVHQSEGRGQDRSRSSRFSRSNRVR